VFLKVITEDPEIPLDEVSLSENLRAVVDHTVDHAVDRESKLSER